MAAMIMVLYAVVSAAARHNMHTAFSAECSPLFDWYATGLFYSHRLSAQPGPITRLLACNREQLADYKGLSIGPTFVHPNLRAHALVAEVGNPTYNKPGSLALWLASPFAPTEEFILFVDADMLLRSPIDPVALGARRGVVVSAEYGYLVGARSAQFAGRFLDPRFHHRQAQVGGFHIFHADDARRLAPRWLQLMGQVRAFAHAEPAAFLNESFLMPAEAAADAELFERRRKQALWHSEMYGYVFAAAEAGMRHRVRRDVMLYPGYAPHLGSAPLILHYGADYKLARFPGASAELRSPEGQGIAEGEYYFNKMSHADYDVTSCPDALPFPEPPPVRGPPEAGGAPILRSRRDLICIEHARTLRAALCGYARARCEDATRWPRECAGPEAARLEEAAVREAQNAFLESCDDTNERCAEWAAAGECGRNAYYMLAQCTRACGACAGAPEAARFSAADAKVGWWEERADDADAAAADAAVAAVTVEELLAAAHLTMAELGVRFYLDGRAAPADAPAAAAAAGRAAAALASASVSARLLAALVVACAAAAACAVGVACRRRQRGRRRAGRWLLPTDAGSGRKGSGGSKLAHD